MMVHVRAPTTSRRGRYPSGRARHALQAGLHASLALLAFYALATTPVVAAHINFGHQHADGTPEHTHALHTILPGAFTAPTTGLESARPHRSRLVLPDLPHVPQSNVGKANAIRAPPTPSDA